MTLIVCLGVSAKYAAGAEAEDANIEADLPVVWSQTFEGSLSAGYNDNLLQDSRGSEESYSLGAKFDATLFRVPLDGRQVFLLLTGDYTAYPEGKEVGHEALLLALAQIKLDLPPRWQVGVDGRYLFLEQVIDTSITEGTLTSSLVQGNGITIQPSAWFDLSQSLRAGLEVPITRNFFRNPFDHYWEGGPKQFVEYLYGHKSTLTLSYQWRKRVYDTREEVSSTATTEPGTELEFQMHETELAWRHNWDKARRWRTVTRLGYLVNLDSGSSGYFDFSRYQFSQQWRFVEKKWEAQAQINVSYHDFWNQTLDNTPETDLRHRVGITATLRAEREVAKHLRVFAEYAYEENFSNRPSDEFRAKKVAGGIECGF